MMFSDILGIPFAVRHIIATFFVRRWRMESLLAFDQRQFQRIGQAIDFHATGATAVCFWWYVFGFVQIAIFG